MTSKTVLTNNARKLAMHTMHNARKQATATMLNTLCELNKVQATKGKGERNYTYKALKGYVLAHITQHSINKIDFVSNNSVSYYYGALAHDANYCQVNIDTTTLRCITLRTYNNNVKRMQAKNERAIRIDNGNY